ncbi:MAG: helix-turn-helix transcriptional regulator [Chloroflexi bacterium]|nr:helix-turn-helix transcriptional regulator [Chloroflexota bacterium]
MSADPLREILLGFVRLHILHHAGQGETYGAWLMTELRRHGYGLGPGTLYPTLHALEEAGLVESRLQVAEGRRRRLYRTTKAGMRVLHDGRRRARALLREIGGEDA